jgi:hypothetical protein
MFWFCVPLKSVGGAPGFIVIKNANYGVTWNGHAAPLAAYSGSTPYTPGKKSEWAEGQWHHVALVDEGIGAGKYWELFVDGVSEFRSVSVRLETPIHNGLPLTFGGWKDLSGFSRALFKGGIDDVLVVRQAITPAQVVRCLRYPITTSVSFSATSTFIGTTPRQTTIASSQSSATPMPKSTGRPVTSGTFGNTTSLSVDPPNGGDNTGPIVGSIVGVIIVLLLIGLVAFYFRNHKSKNASNLDPVPREPESNYSTIPNPSSNSHYAQHAVDFNAGLPMGSNYGRLTPAEEGFGTRI